MVDKQIVNSIIEARIKYIEQMYSRFIQEEVYRNHPIDFKNFIIYDLQKSLNV